MTVVDLLPGIPVITNYIDAGTGSLIIQFLIGGLLGGTVIIKLFWGKIRKFMRNIFSKDNE